MTLPLYRAEHVPSRLPDGAHRGLWFDKFCSEWSGEWNLGQRKLKWLQSVAGECGDKNSLDAATLRTIALVEARSGRWGVLKTVSRFVTGLGLANPAENGFLWHPTLGVPYLPGSSVKGAVKASSGLGDDVLGGENTVGRVAFLDALPPKRIKTEVDIMTPHYGGWTPEDPPGDWRSPTPIPFLTVAPDQPFLFAVIPIGHSAGDTPGLSSEELEVIWDKLVATLEHEGAGAKTAVGYGFLVPDHSAAKALQRTLDEIAVEADPGSPQAVAHSLKARSEQEILSELQRVLSASEDEEPASSAHSLAVVVAGSNFLADWRKERRERGKSGLRDADSFLASWKTGQTIDPDTNIGAKKLKQRASQVEGVLGVNPD